MYEQRTQLSEQFIFQKVKEAEVLEGTVASLLADGFENHLGGLTAQSLIEATAPRVWLSFGGKSINRSPHPIQSRIKSSIIETTIDINSESDSDDDSDDRKWFENP
jgi:hypothetical protein